MPRKRAHAPLAVFMNDRQAGTLRKQPSGAIEFAYAPEWLAWEHAFPVSLSLPMREERYLGASVVAVFDNLLPDSMPIRARVADRVGAAGTDAFSLLGAIGRDCVGAMRFLPEGEAPAQAPCDGEPLDDGEIETVLGDLARAPLGIDRDHDFRISVAGVQEKTALLRHDGRWLRPNGATPTTHLFKPPIGHIDTAAGMVDFRDSVENEHYCLTLLGSLGLPVARTAIHRFGQAKALVVERFDRRWTRDGRLLRLPQEDFCQALSVPPSAKYQSDGGPGLADLSRLLAGSDEAVLDRSVLLKAQLLFWLIGAPDGHAKNFSLFLKPGGRFSLAPLYDVLSGQPAADAGRLRRSDFKLAMSVGRRYRVGDIAGRHFLEAGRAMGLSEPVVWRMVEELRARHEAAATAAIEAMPEGFPEGLHASIQRALAARLRSFDGMADR